MIYKPPETTSIPVPSTTPAKRQRGAPTTSDEELEDLQFGLTDSEPSLSDEMLVSASDDERDDSVDKNKKDEKDDEREKVN